MRKLIIGGVAFYKNSYGFYLENRQLIKAVSLFKIQRLRRKVYNFY